MGRRARPEGGARPVGRDGELGNHNATFAGACSEPANRGLRGWAALAALAIGLLYSAPARAGAVGAATPPVTSGQPLVVRIGLFISNLAAIRDQAQSFNLQGYLILRWHDPRLVTSAEGSEARGLAPETTWKPPVEFANAIAPVAILSSALSAQADGSVLWIQRFDAHLSTELWLRLFPFDHQNLEIALESPPTLGGPVVSFESSPQDDGISPEGFVGLAEWHLDRVAMGSARTRIFAAELSAARADFYLEVSRRPAFYFWKGFLPILLMVAVTMGVFWIDEDQFDWQAKIVVTMMLSLVAFSFAIGNSLPRVSYLTFFDAVFITSLVFEFSTMVELLVIRTMVRRGAQKQAARAHYLARYIYPAVYMLMLGGVVCGFFLTTAHPDETKILYSVGAN